MRVVILDTFVTLVTLPMLTLLFFACASHVAQPRRRFVLLGMGMVVIAVGEWSLPLGLVLLVAYAIVVRHDLRQTWQVVRPQWRRWTWFDLRSVVRRLVVNVWGIGRTGGMRPWLAAQGLRIALALTPHDWVRDLPDMPGIVGIPVRVDSVNKHTPSLDEAVQALKAIQLIVDVQNGAPTEPMPVIVP